MAIVLSIINIGQGYCQLEELTATLNMPNISNRMYQEMQNNIFNYFNDIAWKEMLLAGKEEVKLAINNGEVDCLGRPKIAVIADGAWSKRSYRTKYNALSEVVREKNLVPELSRLGIWNDITKARNLMSYHVESLLPNYNNNAAELYNSILTEFIGGKLVNSVSVFGKICKLRESTSRDKVAKELLFGAFTGNDATSYGIQHEDMAKEQLEKVIGKNIKNAGLIVDHGLSFLAASPDG
ncbi:hypothetical protein QTP88_005726 [Uroleucon formosanum]